MLGKRGVSEIVGFFIITAALFSVTSIVLTAKMRSSELKARGLIEVMREARMRGGELLTFLHARSAGGTCEAYLYNYGSQNVSVDYFFVSGRRTDCTITDAETGAVYDNAIPAGRIVRLAFPAPGQSDFYITLVTGYRGVYCWKVVV